MGSSYYNNPWTAYSNSLADDIPSHCYEHVYSYHEPTMHPSIPSYAFDHDHHAHHFEHHAAPDYGHFLPDHIHTHAALTDEGESKDTDLSGSSGIASTTLSSTYRRVGRHRRRRGANKQQPFE